MPQQPLTLSTIIKSLADAEFQLQTTLANITKELPLPQLQPRKGPMVTLYELTAQLEGTTPQPNVVIEQAVGTI